MKSGLILVMAVFSLQACSQAESASGEPHRQLVWSDDFTGKELDSTKWSAERSCWGGGNNERQCYVDSPDNIHVENGELVLSAFAETHTGPQFAQELSDRGELVTQNYTSGKIRTKGLASWTYGRFEARIKLPKGQSTWPAFWMLPETDVYGGWPQSGEIDIMEAVNLTAICEDCPNGKENRSSAALHFGDTWPENRFLTKTHDLLIDDIEGWHVYALDWREGRMEWFVDDNLFFSLESQDWFTPTVDKIDNANAPFDQPFYLMLNLAVGGNLPDNKNEKAFNPNSFPAQMKVDWVRVYN